MKTYLCLGTNLGDREANIRQALDMLSQALGSKPVAVSSVIETEAWGFEAPSFLNCVACFDWAAPQGPRKLLRICKSVERRMGRRDKPEYASDGRRVYHDRTIDIDILFYGFRTVDQSDLQIPHPLMSQRRFVMDPLSEIVTCDIKEAFPEMFQTK